jgi:AcrR family transcriptional regulator
MRRIPEERFDELVRAAVEVFIERGYRRTQMSDVAEAVGIAKGTLYGYVESKEALFALCLKYADDEGPIPRPGRLPLETPRTGALETEVKRRLAEESVPPALADALGRTRAKDPRGELEAVLFGLYDMLAANRRAIKLIDRCIDHPALGAIWQTAGRETVRAALRRYLESRAVAGQLRDQPNPRLAARIALETLTTWAVHIHWDRAPEPIDPAEARETVIDFLTRSLLP